MRQNNLLKLRHNKYRVEDQILKVREMVDGILADGPQLWCSTVHNTQNDHNSFSKNYTDIKYNSYLYKYIYIYIYIYIYTCKTDGYEFFLLFYCFVKKTQPISTLCL